MTSERRPRAACVRRRPVSCGPQSLLRFWRRGACPRAVCASEPAAELVTRGDPRPPPPGSGSQHLQRPGVDSEPHAGFGVRASLGPRATALRTGLAEAVPNVWVLRRSRPKVRDGSETAPRPQLSRCPFHVMSRAIFVPRGRLAMSGDVSVTTGRGCCRRLLGGGLERGAGAPQSHREACVWPRVSVSPPVCVFTSVSLSLPSSLCIRSPSPSRPGSICVCTAWLQGRGGRGREAERSSGPAAGRLGTGAVASGSAFPFVCIFI